MRIYLRYLFLSFLFSISFSPLFAQTITSVVPESAYQGQQDLQVQISGTNLNFTQGSSVLIWLKQGSDSIAGNSLNLISQNIASSFFSFSLSAAIGFYDLYCLNGITSQTAVLQNGFEILPSPPTPGSPVLISPSDNSTVDNTIVSFDWNDPLNAYRYELIVDDEASFTSPIIHQLHLQGSNYSNLNLSMNNGIYFWKVRAKNISEIWSNWSTVNSFTINAIPQIISVSPDNGYVGQTNLSVNISGVNTHFAQASSTIDFWFQQQTSAIISTQIYATSSVNANMNLNIPETASTGYYDLFYTDYLEDTLVMFNSFYVHESNEFSGTIFIDANNNQIYDIGEVPFSQGIISGSSGNQYSFSQSNGYFHGYATSGNFTFILSNIPQHYALTPSQHSAMFSGSGETDLNNDFALHPIPGINDLRIALTNNTPARPGLIDRLTLTITNHGTVSENGTITLTSPPALSVISSSNSAYTISSNTVTWNYTGLQPFDVQQITIDLDVPISVQAGSILSFTAQVTSGNTPSENPDYLEQTVVNSYDPNIKEVLPAAGLTPQQAADGEYLQYTIHFQNTGTAEAINIRILDTLNPFLDITTFQVLAASHPWQARLLENRLAEFRFDNINLPDSNANEILSHGFIKYRIKPTSAFAIGDQIENTAHIYFDFNSPIVTNTTVTSIITAIEETNQSQLDLLVTPNPFNSQTNISYTIRQSDFVSIKLYNSNGQLIKLISSEYQQSGNHKIVLNMAELSGGIYFIVLTYGEVNKLEKLVLVK
jgi:uncharacterized repeat protein (TIGR01451 family)